MLLIKGRKRGGGQSCQKGRGDWINVGRREKLRQSPKKMPTAKDAKREVTKEQQQMNHEYTTVSAKESKLKDLFLKSHLNW